MTDPGWISILPPLAGDRPRRRHPPGLPVPGGRHLAWAGRFMSEWHPGRGLAAAIESTVTVLGSAGDARVILFTLVIGALIATVEASGGVAGLRGAGWRGTGG